MDTQEFKRQCDNGRSDFSGENLNIRLLQSALDLSGFKFKEANFNNSIILNAQLINADFRDAKIENADLRGTNLTSANLEKVLITSTDLSGAKLTNAKLKEATIERGSVLQNVDFTQAQFDRANFDNSDCSNANFSDAYLIQVRALNTKFISATFTGAYLKYWHWNYTNSFESIKIDYFYLDHPNINDRQRYYTNGQRFDLVYYQSFFENFINQIRLESRSKTVDILLNFVLNLDHKDRFVIFQSLVDQFIKDQQLKYQTKDSITRKDFSSWITNNENNTIILLIDEYLKNEHQFYTDGKVEINNPILQTLLKDNIFITFMSTDKQQNNKKYQAQGGDGSQNVAADRINLQDSSKIENNHSNSGDRNNEEIKEIVEKLNRILQKLEESYDIKTISGKANIITGAIEKIERDRPLKTKVVSAIKSGGSAALAQFLSHPAASAVIAAFNDWQK